MSDGFLGRWSRRKIDAKDGKPLEEPPPQPPVTVPPAAPQPVAVQAKVEPVAPPPEAPPPLTLADAQALTAESDFKPFMASNVSPEVKNAAMKKLFADPRYNVMDRMDIYIDDYSKSDPIPESMLRQMASAKFLNLFDDKEEEKPVSADGGDDADRPAAPVVAQSGLCNDLPSQPDGPMPPASPEHADPDLRLQQDDAPPGKKPGDGPQ
jgi:hypothetical protein